MKRFKSILCLLLAGVMILLAACSGKETNGGSSPGQSGNGRYVEKDVTPPIDGTFVSFPASDGTIVCYSEGLKTRYESRDGGETWTESPGPGHNTDRFELVRTGTLLPDGSLLAYIPGEGLEILAPDGSGKRVPLSEIDEALAQEENVSVSLLQALGNDRLLIAYMIGGFTIVNQRPDSNNGSQTQPGGRPSGGSVTFSGSVANPNAQGGGPAGQSGGPAGQSGGPSNQGGGPAGASRISSKALLYDLSADKTISELPVDNVSAAASDDTNLYIMGIGGDISVFDLNKGAPVTENKISFGNGSGMNNTRGMIALQGSGGSTLATGNDGGLYAARDGALLLADKNGNISTVLESTSYSIGTPRSSVSSIFILADGSIIINMQESDQANRLYKYVWDETATIDPDKTLAVWSLDDNTLVRAAIAEMRKKHPDAYITYEVALGGNNAISAPDAIKTLNTRLLNGSGPDVIILDGCPAESYAAKGILLDISGMLDTSDIYDNLLAPYYGGGKLYFLPTQLLMPALMGSADALAQVNTLDDLVSLVVNGNDLPAGGDVPRQMSEIPEEQRAAMYFRDLKELCNILWLSSAPSIVADNKLSLDALREYLEAVKSVSDKYGLATSAAGNIRGGMMVGFSDGGTTMEIPGSLIRYITRMTNYGAFAVGNLMILQMMSDRAGSEMMPFPGLTPSAWKPSTIAGVSADAKNKEFAAELIRIMISPQIQQINYSIGLPITQAGIAAQLATINDRLAQMDQDPFDYDIGALVRQLQVPSMSDLTLTDMMWNSIERCCKGELSVDGAVKEIEQSIKNYLAERS